jgi:hypothetical protein
MFAPYITKAVWYIRSIRAENTGYFNVLSVIKVAAEGNHAHGQCDHRRVEGVSPQHAINQNATARPYFEVRARAA